MRPMLSWAFLRMRVGIAVARATLVWAGRVTVLSRALRPDSDGGRRAGSDPEGHRRPGPDGSVSAKRDVAPLSFRATGGTGLLVALGLGVAALTSDPATADDPFTTLALIRPPRIQAAQPFTLPTLTGPPIRLADYRGRVVLLNFWATWCPACQAEMPAMERLYQAFKDRGLGLLAISIDADGRSAVEPFVRGRTFTYPIGLDPKMAIADRYGVRALPMTVLVDRSGNLVARAVGPREWDAPAAHAVVEFLLDRQ